MDEPILIDVCASLVVIDEKSSVIQLVRQSPFGCDTALSLLLTDPTTQKYFESKRDFVLPDAQANIEKTCRIYLSLDRFKKSLRGREVWSTRCFGTLLHTEATTHTDRQKSLAKKIY